MHTVAVQDIWVVPRCEVPARMGFLVWWQPEAICSPACTALRPSQPVFILQFLRCLCCIEHEPCIVTTTLCRSLAYASTIAGPVRGSWYKRSIMAWSCQGHQHMIAHHSLTASLHICNTKRQMMHVMRANRQATVSYSDNLIRLVLKWSEDICHIYIMYYSWANAAGKSNSFTKLHAQASAHSSATSAIPTSKVFITKGCMGSTVRCCTQICSSLAVADE